MAGYVRVRVPVANLRTMPVEAAALTARDEMQESQLLFNEVLAVGGEQGGWLRVEALEQQKLTGGGWQGYPGWVRKKDAAPSDGPAGYDGVVKAAFTIVRSSPFASGPAVFPLCLGTRFSFTAEAKGFVGFPMEDGKTGWAPKSEIALTPPAARARARELVRIARLFLGATYLWGGRSMPMPWSRGPVMGVDCSGLVSLVFRAAGLDVPRDARDQWTKAVPVEAARSMPGDLVFLARPGETDSVRHVMLYLGGEQLIEAAETGDAVRIRTFSQRLGLDLKGLAKGNITGDGKRVYFGRML